MILSWELACPFLSSEECFQMANDALETCLHCFTQLLGAIVIHEEGVEALSCVCIEKTENE